MLSVFDAQGVSLANLRGDAARFLIEASAANQGEKEGRNCGIVIANAPGWFAGAWSVLARVNCFSAETLSKTKILRAGNETYEGLRELIDHDQIPEQYGGGKVLRGGEEGEWDCDDEVRLREFLFRQEANRKQVGSTKS